MAINLNDLDSDQRRAATAPRGPVCIVAGAGTGKTRTITYRIAHQIDQGLVSPQRMLAVTYTRKAAQEMRDRLHEMGVQGPNIATFHSATRRQLAYFWPQVFGDLPWRLESRLYPLVRHACQFAGLGTTKTNVRDVMAEISWAKASLISPRDYAAKVSSLTRTPPGDPEKVARAYRFYEDKKAQPEGMILDFDDLLIHTAAAFEQSPAVAEEFRAQYKSFTVDEYQDVTPLQQRVLRAWLGQRDDLTVVGDANQTIYSFTGATPDFLLNFGRDYPNATVVQLTRDYRSTPEIVELANTVIGQAKGRVAGTRLTLEGMLPSGPEPKFSAHSHEQAEADYVASRIKKLAADGVPLKEIAVLFRTNAQSEAYETALANSGITYQVRGGDSFYERPEIKQAIKGLTEVLRARQLPANTTPDALMTIVRKVLKDAGYTADEPDGFEAKEQWRALKAFEELCATIINTQATSDLYGLLVEVKRRSESQANPSADFVTLASMHSAKGLEWDAVFLVGLNEGSLPIRQAIKAGDYHIEEERRLFYVGITRARKQLFLSWSLAKGADSSQSRNRTRFLDQIVEDESDTAPKKKKSSKRRGTCRRCRAPLSSMAEKSALLCHTCSQDTDPAIVEALRQWRLARAQEANVPAYVVFTDATLLALADALPTTPSELLAVSGIGPMKVAEFGEDLLEFIAQYT